MIVLFIVGAGMLAALSASLLVFVLPQVTGIDSQVPAEYLDDEDYWNIDCHEDYYREYGSDYYE